MYNDLFLLFQYKSLLFQIRYDHGFCNDMQSVPVSCSLCNATLSFGTYEVFDRYKDSQIFIIFILQNHIGQNHPDEENSAGFMAISTEEVYYYTKL